MIETPAEILAHYASREAAKSFVAWRKSTKKPLTERAALMIAKTLAAIQAAGGDADEALDMAQEHGWQTIKLEWYQRAKHGNRTSAGGNSASDATIDAISIAARAHRTPSAGSF